MNKKGFTMVELLVAMSIMGLLIIMAFPTMRAVQTNNQKKNYQSYGDAIVSAAKLYTDSYAEDLFRPDTRNETKSLSVSESLKKGLIKNKGVSGVDCVTQSTVTIAKYNTDYAYCLSLKCTTGETTVYEEKNRKGSCAEFKEAKVIYKYNGSSKEINIVAGEEYKVLKPENLGYDLAANKDVFIDWQKEGTDNHYLPGDIINIPVPESNTEVPTITLVAQTRKFKYNVIYDKGVGTGTMTPNPKPCTIGRTCKLEKNKFTKTGYHFTHWKYDASHTYNDEKELNGVVDNLIKKDGQDFKITAQFAINQCKVTFDANNGKFGTNSSSTEQTVNYGGYFGDNPTVDGIRDAKGGYYNATRTGYHIDEATAWTDGTTTYDEDKSYKAEVICPNLATKSESKTLKVNWKINQCTVTFAPNGGTFGTNSTDTKQTVNYGSYFGDNPVVNGMRNANGGTYNATKTGYHADPATAWIDGTTTYDETKSYKAETICPNLATKSESRTLKVNWKTNQCFIKINANGGFLKTDHGSNYTLSSGKVLLSGNETIHTINYGSSIGTNGIIDYNNSSALNLGRTGYNVVGGAEWNTAANGSGTTYNQTTNYTAAQLCSNINTKSENTTLYTKWVAKKVTVTFDCNGGTGGGSSTYTYDVSGQAFDKTCSKTGSDQDGWKKDANAGSRDYTTTNSVSNNWIDANSPSIKLYAHWKAKSCVVNLNGNTATTAGSASASVDYGKTTLSTITNPKKEVTITYVNNVGAKVTGGDSTKAYPLNGWYTASSGGSKVASNAATPALQASVSGFTDASRKWTRTSCPVTLYAQWDSTTATLPTVTKKGYVCNWTTNDGANTVASGGTWTFTSANERTFTAACTLDKTVTKVGDADIYYINYVSKNCDKDNNEYTSSSLPDNTRNRPYRKYKYHKYDCNCDLNSGNMYVLDKYERTVSETNVHQGGHMVDFYTDGENGEDACRGDGGIEVNENVSALCFDGSFSYSNSKLEIVNGTNYRYFNGHGYRWYESHPGDNRKYHSFNSGWLHSAVSDDDEKYDDRYKTGDNLHNGKEERQKACHHICKLKYPIK